MVVPEHETSRAPAPWSRRIRRLRGARFPGEGTLLPGFPDRCLDATLARRDGPIPCPVPKQQFARGSQEAVDTPAPLEIDFPLFEGVHRPPFRSGWGPRR